MSGRRFVIREACAADAHAIAEVHIRTWQEAYADQLPKEYLDRLPESLERRAQFWKGIAEAPGDREAVLVADVAGRIVGFVHVCPSRDPFAETYTGEVTAIYLREANWGQGIGRALLKDATARLKGFGFKHATLWVLNTNVRTRRFYEAAGWEMEGSEKVDRIGDLALQEVRYRIDL